MVPAKGKTFEYTVYLGVFEVREAVEFVREFFKDTTEEVNRATGYVCVASLKTDIRGQYLANSLGISTLTWAFAQLEQGRITDSEWADEFRELEEGLENECSVILAKELSATSLRILQKMIVEAIGWSRKPDLKIYCKREEKIKRKETDEMEIRKKPKRIISLVLVWVMFTTCIPDSFISVVRAYA